MSVDAGKAGSYLSGVLFAVGWWIFVDGVATAAHRDSAIPFNFIKYLPGIGSTLAFFLLNTLDWEMLSADSMTYHGGDGVACRARTFVLFCVAMSLGGLIGSIFVLTHTYVANPFDETTWPGVAVLLQNVMIFLATIVMRGGLIVSASY
ncbi:hypothetical protein Poli38472_012095 [Pythium oligandrum]|uniref:Uncharacterized protein n=1 Tax=Pythium oligandrum TaxID=41045 RepID=A0A8K1CPQ9_PYTOL|nr:hypothetical protein Poli38472_012095 [Pythium oligandrum]|eukprot:TMW66979.1 hypothetical protein Poli38472_012095 [Pythium oligandrum]